MIDEASIQSLKASIDIVDVIGGYIELKKSGANYKANCPFHGEKTPSFVVSPAKQIYHCFGCGVGGDAIKFVMEMEKLNYVQSIEKLASSYNFTLRHTKNSGEYDETKRILEATQHWYLKNLNTNALQYLKQRSISASSIEKFGIGYAPVGTETLSFLKQSHLPIPKAIDAGVVASSQNGNRVYARLQERITFPIYNSAGAIVGFGGRTLSNHPAKYINSPQTKLFNKSKLLYGYHLAKATIYKKNRIIISEGYIDVIMLHQAGFTEAVATLGTALTPQHLPLLRKGDPQIILAYDGDKAGVEAAFKGASMLSKASFDGGVVLFKDGSDPADMVADSKSTELAELFRKPKPFTPFVMEHIASRYDLKNPHQKEEALKQIKDFLLTLSPIMQEAYAPTAASILKVRSVALNRPSTKQISSSVAEKKEDIALLMIIKTIAENSKLARIAVDYLDRDLFVKYATLFELVTTEKYDDPIVQRLLIDDEIGTIEEQNFNKALCQLLIRFYEEKLTQINRDKNLCFSDKSYMIRKIKLEILPSLSRGKLIASHKHYFK